MLMCESKAVLVKNGHEEKIMDEVAFLEVKNGKIVLENIMGRVLEVNYALSKIDFINHKIIFTKK